MTQLGFDPRHIVSLAMASGLIRPPEIKSRVRVVKLPPTPESIRRERHKHYMANWRADHAEDLKESARLLRAQNLAAGLRADGKPRVRKIYAVRNRRARS